MAKVITDRETVSWFLYIKNKKNRLILSYFRLGDGLSYPINAYAYDTLGADEEDEE
jgi:hypothetical protein